MVGCGAMGRRHLRGLGALRAAGLGIVDLIAVCDLDERLATRAADEAEALTGRRPRVVVTSLDELLHDDEVAGRRHRHGAGFAPPDRRPGAPGRPPRAVREAALDHHPRVPSDPGRTRGRARRHGPGHRGALPARAREPDRRARPIAAGHPGRGVPDPDAVGGRRRPHPAHARGAICARRGPSRWTTACTWRTSSRTCASSPWREVWGRGFIAVPIRRRADEAVFAADVYGEAMANAPAEIQRHR